jgi:hypothetical protein
MSLSCFVFVYCVRLNTKTEHKDKKQRAKVDMIPVLPFLRLSFPPLSLFLSC